MLCTQGPVRCPAELSVEPEFRRGHGAACAALARSRTDAAGLRRLQVAHLEPARDGEPLMFGVDTTPPARPDAEHTGGRTMVQTRRKGGDAFLPGFDYSLVVGVGWGACSWVSPVEARRVAPGDDHTALTVAQVRDVLADLAATSKAAPSAGSSATTTPTPCARRETWPTPCAGSGSTGSGKSSSSGTAAGRECTAGPVRRAAESSR
jgi:hypothetical protein